MMAQEEASWLCTCCRLNLIGILVQTPLSRGKMAHLVMFSSRLDLPASRPPTTTTRGRVRRTSGMSGLIFSTALLKLPNELLTSVPMIPWCLSMCLSNDSRLGEDDGLPSVTSAPQTHQLWYCTECLTRVPVSWKFAEVHGYTHMWILMDRPGNHGSHDCSQCYLALRCMNLNVRRGYLTYLFKYCEAIMPGERVPETSRYQQACSIS